MRVERLFSVLVVHGAILAGCAPPQPGDDPSSRRGETTDSGGVGTDSGEVDTGTASDATCGDAVCLDTTVWSECTSDGVLCCWATDACCDHCCGDTQP